MMGNHGTFDRPDKRAKARLLVETMKPLFLFASPVCTPWCTWQALNAYRYNRGDELQRERVRSIVHLRFLIELYHIQMDNKRYFVHEHPARAASWELDIIKDVMNDPRVDRADCDQCQYGAEVRFGSKLGAPVCKPSGFMSNSPFTLSELKVRCQGRQGECSRQGGGVHAQCSGRIASDAARYPVGLVRAILKGFRKQLEHDGLLLNGVFGLQPAFEEDEHEYGTPRLGLTTDTQIGHGIGNNHYGAGPVFNVTSSPNTGTAFCSGRFKDDLTKQPLRDALVREAR